MKLIILCALFLSSSLMAQNLHKERIWKMTDKKRSIYFDKGVFHSPKNNATQSITNVRTSYVKARGYERIVFDFSSNTPPRVYGYIAQDTKKVYMDFFNTKVTKKLDDMERTEFIKSLNFFNLDKDKLSAELELNVNASFDIFYLSNPGRIVVDIKK